MPLSAASTLKGHIRQRTSPPFWPASPPPCHRRSSSYSTAPTRPGASQAAPRTLTTFPSSAVPAPVSRRPRPAWCGCGLHPAATHTCAGGEARKFRTQPFPSCFVVLSGWPAEQHNNTTACSPSPLPHSASAPRGRPDQGLGPTGDQCGGRLGDGERGCGTGQLTTCTCSSNSLAHC